MQGTLKGTIDLLFDLLKNILQIWCTAQRRTFLNQSNRRSTGQWYFPFKCSLVKRLSRYFALACNRKQN